MAPGSSSDRRAGPGRSAEEATDPLPRRPVPVPTPLSAPHWAGGARGELLVQRCERCGFHPFPPEPACPRCQSPLAWVVSSGRGEVYSYTVVHRPPGPAFAAPYVVATIVLDEGWAMFSNVVGCPPEDVRVGLPVQVDFEAVGDEVWLPLFVPASDGGRP